MGESAFVALNDYERKYLIFHLAEAGESDELNKLLTLSTPEKLNAWFDYKDAYGEIDAYLDEIYIGLKISLTKAPSRTYTVADRISWPIFYTLLHRSVVNIVLNIPPALLKSLVKHCIWTEEKALHYAFRIPNNKDMSEAVVELVPLLSEERKEIVFNQVSEMTDEPVKLSLLISLSGLVPDSLAFKVVEQFIHIENQYARKNALMMLVPVLNGTVREWLIEQVIDGEVLEYEDDEVELLKAYIPYTPNHLVERMASKISWFPYKEESFRAFSLLRSKLPDDWLNRILFRFPTMHYYASNREACIYLLVELASRGRAIEAMEQILVIEDKSFQFEALAKVAPYLFKEDPVKAMKLVKDIKHSIHQSEAVIALSSLVTESQLKKLLTIAKAIWTEMERAEALLALAKRISHAERSSLLEEVWSSIADGELILRRDVDELFRYRSPTRAFSAVYCWCALAPDFAKLGDARKTLKLFEKAYNGRAGIDTKESELFYDIIAISIANSAPYLPKDALPEVLELVDKLSDKAKGIALEGLAQYLSLTQLEASFKAAQSIDAIQATVRYASPEWLDYFLKHRLPLFIDEYRPSIINILASYMAPSILPEALRITRQVKDEYGTARALAGLSRYLAQPLQDEVLTEAYNQIENLPQNDFGTKATFYKKCAPLFNTTLLWQMLSNTRSWYSLSKEETQLEILTALAYKGCILESFEAAEELLEGDLYCDYLSRVLRLLPSAQQSAVLDNAMGWKDRDKVSMLSKLTAVEEQWSDVLLNLTASIDNPFDKKDVLISLCKVLDNRLSKRMINIGETIKLPILLIQATSAIFHTYSYPHNSFVAGAISQLKTFQKKPPTQDIWSYIDERDWADAITSLGPMLTNNQVDEILNEILPLLPEQQQKSVTASLAKYMSYETLQQADRLAKKYNWSDKDDVVVAMAARLAELGYVDQAFYNVKGLQSIVYRLNFYQTLSPEVLEKNIMRALMEIEHFYQNDEKLVSMAILELIPYIKSMEHLQKTIKVLQLIQNKFSRSEVLEKLITSILNRDQRELEIVYRLLFITGNDHKRVHTFFDLHAGAPLLYKIGGEACIKKIVDDIMKIITWWP